MDSMFCFQCEQTAQSRGCTVSGACGKDPETAALQDLLLHVCGGIASFAHRARLLDARDRDVDRFVVKALFTTVTNVNFDPERLQQLLNEADAMLQKSRELYRFACDHQRVTPEKLNGATSWKVRPQLDDLIAQGRVVGLNSRKRFLDPDVASVQEILLYGLKGTAAYAHHAAVLGREDESFFAFMHEALAAVEARVTDIPTLLALCLRCGEVNLNVMAMLDAIHCATYGSPQPTAVRIDPVKGKAILVSGHDLKDLELLLQQTEGKGIHIYTHGEMLPAHGYPQLKKYPHLVGNYGGAWQNQREEFEQFPGAILMTTNCIQKPKDLYFERIFTSGVVAWPGVHHISDHNFAPVIDAALAADGFTEDGPGRTITVGFGHNAILAHAGTIVDAVKAGALKHFFVIGGCDGAKAGRNYFTELAHAVPQDCAILTLGCGKYRFNKDDFGTIGGIPRLLDCGQCNDAYSAIKVAVALAEAFKCGVNDLPLSLVLSWFEQKAVAVLLTLLHLGVQDIRLGPTLPAFVSPGVAKVLSEKFGLKGISTVEEDLKACLTA